MRIVELARGADVLIHEGQYTPEELPRFRGWGHSSWAQAVEVAERFLDKVQLLDRRNEYPSRLSGGQAQRVAEALASLPEHYESVLRLK